MVGMKMHESFKPNTQAKAIHPDSLKKYFRLLVKGREYSGVAKSQYENPVPLPS
jgi:hypothetical protein